MGKMSESLLRQLRNNGQSETVKSGTVKKRRGSQSSSTKGSHTKGKMSREQFENEMNKKLRRKTKNIGKAKKETKSTCTIGNLITRLEQLRKGTRMEGKELDPKATSQDWYKFVFKYHVKLLFKDILKKSKKQLTQP